MIVAFERAKTVHASDRSTTVISIIIIIVCHIIKSNVDGNFNSSGLNLILWLQYGYVIGKVTLTHNQSDCNSYVRTQNVYF
jgi:hypothetical protein